MDVYRPTILSLQQLCVVVFKKNEEVLGCDIRKLPTCLKEYVEQTKLGVVYIGVVDCTNERTFSIWMDVSTREKYDRLVGRTAYQCFLCCQIDYCWRFLEGLRDQEFCLFPDSPSPICFCCSRPAFLYRHNRYLPITLKLALSKLTVRLVFCKS
jgi:hypothetical protein